ncbi:putative nicotinate-nucleotide adenylyltransferase [Rubrivivax sp. A210]|uniref:nicotinate-nucleotide adenylyltransferase n=1 Tax=Rubrivivax sp. A210 TaxID=2772301 RepID=UPI001917A91C|nr:nicotinate-nucleotide adenylyltransferase [Rubrivivax sp. A210]CAD5372031.1 putative nicotinate-nucleotide adenylyltransferase [Rubrivivax sp. A210]
MTRRAALFGGSFDPVHRAHVALAQAALDGLQLDEVRWVPAGQPWQKARTLTDAAHRVAMLRLAIAHEPRFVLDPIEIERSGASYTLDTVKALQAREPHTEWVLLMGQDQYAGLHTWHGWQDLMGRVVLAVAGRPGETGAVHPEVLRHPHRMVPLPLTDLSSTGVRQGVAQGRGIAALVPPAVAGYIESHGLYGPDTRS